MLTMLLREVSYGIYIGFNNITVSPFGKTDFNFVVENLEVSYSQQTVSFNMLPGSGNKVFRIDGLLASTSYKVTSLNIQTVTTDASGTLSFTNAVGEGPIVVTVA